MSYIYFIQAHGDGPIKIGFTASNPRRRMVEIQVSCPWPIKLLGAIEGTVSQEKQIHLVLGRFKTSGEWFEPHPIVIAAVKTAMECGVPAPENISPAVDPDSHPLRLWRHSQTPRKTLVELANDMGVTPGHISAIENWNNKPSFRLYTRLYRVTGIKIDRFIRNIEPPQTVAEQSSIT
jgi:hypothetical protein